MNAKHLFLTVMLLFASMSVMWGATYYDVISFENIRDNYSGAKTDDKLNNLSAGWSDASSAVYKGYMYYNSSTSKIGIATSVAFCTTASEGVIKSVTVNFDASAVSGQSVQLCVGHSAFAAVTTKKVAQSNSSEKPIITYDGSTSSVKYDAFGADYEYIAIVASAGSGITDVRVSSIVIEWYVESSYAITQGAITGTGVGEWDVDLSVDKTLANAGETVTITVMPISDPFSSLTSISLDGIEFDLSCIGYVDFIEEYTLSFIMPERPVTITAVFDMVFRDDQAIEVSTTSASMNSGLETAITFNRRSFGGDPITEGEVYYEISDPDIAVVTVVDNGDGTGTCTLKGLKTGTATLSIAAQKTTTVTAGFSDEITIHVYPREVALVSEYSERFYAMANTIGGDGMAQAAEVYKSGDVYYYNASDLVVANYTWNAVTLNAGETNFTIQNPSTNKYLSVEGFDFKMVNDSYTWYNSAGKRKDENEKGIVYNSGEDKFSVSKDLTTGAKEALIATNLRPLNYSTASSSAGVYDTRTLSEGDWGTICVPFNVTDVSEAGADFFTLTGKHVEAEELVGFYLSELPVSSLTAGRSYIYHVQAGKSAITLNGASAILTEADNSVLTDGFVGILPGDCDGTGKVRVENESKDKENGNFVMSGGKFRYISAGGASNVKAYRAYIDAGELDASSGTPAPGRRILYIKDMQDVATDIEDLTVGQLIDWSKPVYNIMGMQVGKGATGVLIQDGQKFIVQ